MTQAIFLSYASEDSDAARRICEALRAAGLEVWFDQSELRGGDAWDQSIRKQIKECALFVPVISANTDARPEGYFRLEWKLAVDRSHLMADNMPFLMPVMVGEVTEATALVPDRFRERQWSRLDDDHSIVMFATRVQQMLRGERGQESGRMPAAQQKVVRSFATPAGAQPAARRRGIWIAAAAVLIVVVGAYGALVFLRASNEAIGSIAVLPFQTKNADQDADYLADGLAETLIYQLSQLPKLKVSPGSSVFRYKGKDVDPLKVGTELGVLAVMTGRVVQRGENLSISVELVDVRNNKSLWGEKYERKLTDLLATQREIGTEIARKLQINLSGESERLMTRRFTQNNEAYQLYLKGQYQYARRGHASLLRAVDFFQQAIKLDPGFAKAHVGLADTYSIIAFNRDMPASEVLSLATAAATRAIALDPALAEAHAAKATMAAMAWQWEDSRRGFQRAIEINGDVAEIRFRHAFFYLIPVGRCDDAIAEIRRAAELEPQSTVYAAVLTTAYLCAGQHQKALEQARKAYALEPDHPVAASWLNAALLANGNPAQIQREVVQLPRPGEKRAPSHWMGIYYAKTGMLREAREELDALVKSIGSTGSSEYAIAMLAANIGERDLAFKWLEKAYSNRLFLLAYLKRDAFLASLREDPRFADLLKRMGLPR